MRGAEWSAEDDYTPAAAAKRFEIAGWEADAFKRELDAAGVNFSLSLREYARLGFDSKDVDWCLRLSPHYYNTIEEIDAVASFVSSIAERA